MANTPFVVFAQNDTSAQIVNADSSAAGNPAPETTAAAPGVNEAAPNQTVIEVQGDAKGGNGNPPPQPQPSFNMMIPFIILIGVMIAISIRTSSKEKKKREQMMNSIRKGTKIMTSGGIIGEIAEVQQDQFLLKIANNVQIVISRAAIAQVIQTGDAADDTKAEVTKK